MVSVIIEKFSVGDPANILEGSTFGLGSGKASLRKRHVSWSLWDKQRSPNVSDPLPHNVRCSQPHTDLVPVDSEVASSWQALTNFMQSLPQTASPQPCRSLSSHTGASLLFPGTHLVTAYGQPEVCGGGGGGWIAHNVKFDQQKRKDCG